ncbi:TPM domain-containing protein [Sphingorhabdus sp. IMCC26285]|uniref:TPM domain-containing protein n=1 Tax=Sphingorhabdus profundilacus TaxID=2509718 RepID=A0A6I4LVR1_9SPHN|nr:TPM domain-containing protein [Sphingorhabdus profundilacus]MVZ97442.1 TPM domain-containing protein [Sphingorhabdus profundilacus]
MKKAIGLLVAALLVLTGQSALAQTFPKLSGRVVDEANLLDPAQEAALTAKLEGLETRTNRQLVVATLNSLEGYEISDYGYRLGRHWAIGQDGKGESEKDNGAILIVAPNERKMRIEVGYGLEPILTDGLSSSIIRNDITPRFKDRDFPGGINAGVDRIVTQLELPADEAAKVAAQAQKNQKDDEGFPLGALIFLLFIFFFVLLPIMQSMKGGGRRHRRGGVGPVIIWGGGDWGGGGGGSSWGGGGGGGFGGFSGGGGGFGGGGASGGW